MNDWSEESKCKWKPLEDAVRVIAKWNDDRFQGVLKDISHDVLAQSYSVLMRHWWRLAQEQQYHDQLWQDKDKRLHFNWSALWRLSRTDPLWFQPYGWNLKGIFWLYHCTGSIVSSSCLCESAGSLLKIYSRGGADTSRVVERTMLRYGRVAGDGSDDAFVLRAWLETAQSPEKLSFFFSNRERREKKFSLGGGSKTLHQMRARLLKSRKWNSSRLRLIPSVAKRVLKSSRPVSVRQWADARKPANNREECCAAGWVGRRPSLLGWRPLLLGRRPSLLGWRPLLLGRRPSLLGWRPLLLGWRPSLLGWRPSLLGWRPLLLGWRPSLLGWRPLLLGWRPSLWRPLLLGLGSPPRSGTPTPRVLSP